MLLPPLRSRASFIWTPPYGFCVCPYNRSKIRQLLIHSISVIGTPKPIMKLSHTLFGLATVAAWLSIPSWEQRLKSLLAKLEVSDTLPTTSPLKLAPPLNSIFFRTWAIKFKTYTTKLIHSQNHSVVQSSFANPCHPLAGSFFSSFVPTKNSPFGTSFTVIVNDTRLIWFYCSQTFSSYCQSGTSFFCSKTFFSHSIYRYGRRNQCAFYK